MQIGRQTVRLPGIILVVVVLCSTAEVEAVYRFSSCLFLPTKYNNEHVSTVAQTIYFIYLYRSYCLRSHGWLSG